MSVIIHGLDMPKDGVYWCEIGIAGKIATITIHGEDRKSFPLVPLPEGHGRLGDLDALFEKMYHLSDNEGAHKDSHADDALILRDSACYLIEDAPTIVPTEGGTEDGN